MPFSVPPVVFAVALVLLAPAAALAQVVEFEGRAWFTRLDASAQVKSGSLPGTRVDLEDDLSVDRDNSMPEVRFTLATGISSRLRLAYLRADLEGDTTLERNIEFDGTTFTASTRVETEVELHYARLGWAYVFPVVPGMLKVGPLLEIKGVLIDAALETRGSGSRVRESASLPLAFPTVGVMLGVSPHKMLDVFAEASGVPFGDLGYVVDAEAGLRFIPFHFVSLSAGYRLFDVRVGEKDDDFAKVQLSGPFVGLSVRF
jgi:hypothetical protein